MFASCFQYLCSWNDEELDIDLCDSNAIVEITLHRDYLLLKLQDLVDSNTAEDVEQAIQSMDEAANADDQRLLRFLVRAGTLEILHDVLERDLKDGRPSSVVASGLLTKLSSVVTAR
jgi:hypothetical protein